MELYYPESSEEFYFVQSKYSLDFTHVGIIEANDAGFLHSDYSLGTGIPIISTVAGSGVPTVTLDPEADPDKVPTVTLDPEADPDKCLVHNKTVGGIYEQEACSGFGFRAVCKERLGNIAVQLDL